VKLEQIDGSEQRDISLTIRGHEVSFKGHEYLLHFALPNFYFHATTACVILRHNGLQIGQTRFFGHDLGVLRRPKGAPIGRADWSSPAALLDLAGVRT